MTLHFPEEFMQYDAVGAATSAGNVMIRSDATSLSLHSRV
jgi:hypothetical protein